MHNLRLYGYYYKMFAVGVTKLYLKQLQIILNARNKKINFTNS